MLGSALLLALAIYARSFPNEDDGPRLGPSPVAVVMGDVLPMARFQVDGGFVNEYEVRPPQTNCSAHGLPLRLERVPVVGGFITPTFECHLSKRYPYGRVAASSGAALAACG